MQRLSAIAAFRAWRKGATGAGRRVALVPTMGALHAGHLALVDAARAAADLVVMSVFVNPLQFRPGEDFDHYPRDLERDQALAASRSVDVLFTPTVEEMYGAGDELRIVAGEAAKRWEGATRPGHFDGVLTVVAKLFNIVAPDVAVFGQKDVQQVTLIRQMITELNFPIELRVIPIVREEDGLAMSSRNVYLSAEQRVAATALSRALREVSARWRGGESSAGALERAARQVLDSAGGVTTEYIAVTESGRLAPVARVQDGVVVVVAARVGSTRLIDNLVLTQGGA